MFVLTRCAREGAKYNVFERRKGTLSLFNGFYQLREDFPIPVTAPSAQLLCVAKWAGYGNWG